jgi:hypothetical protein
MNFSARRKQTVAKSAICALGFCRDEAHSDLQNADTKQFASATPRPGARELWGAVVCVAQNVTACAGRAINYRCPELATLFKEFE